MIQTIEQATQTRILIGQNGIVVVAGRSAEGTQLAIRAIRMVEEEAHTSNLTQRIKTLLNVPEPQSTETISELAAPEGQKLDGSSSSIPEAEEQVQEDLEKGDKE
jgi:exosome complex component RRP4